MHSIFKVDQLFTSAGTQGVYLFIYFRLGH